MNIYEGARSIALRRDLDAMSFYYEERSASSPRKHMNLAESPRPGLCFFFHGIILSDCEYFSLNFMSGRKINDGIHDICLQIGARLPQNYIIRNSRLMGKWGPEENSSNLPFQLKRGKTFWMQVLLTNDSFYVSVNGYHFAQYYYRMPYVWLSAVDVRGDVSDIVIEVFHVKEYPIRVHLSVAKFLPKVQELHWAQNAHTMAQDWLRIDVPSKFLKHVGGPQSRLNLPFYGRIPDDKKLTDGQALRIEGRVHLMPQSFTVALQIGQCVWPQPTVSLFFSPNFLRSSRARVGKAVIVRSAYINGEWVNREVSRLYTNLAPGKAFVIMIACRKQRYDVYVNNKLLLAFKHQMNPEEVDMVHIRGDVKLWSVVV
ncbi:hypothetical protein KR222_002316, partial [Zaprionus bogoriensis]